MNTVWENFKVWGNQNAETGFNRFWRSLTEKYNVELRHLRNDNIDPFGEVRPKTMKRPAPQRRKVGKFQTKPLSDAELEELV